MMPFKKQSQNRYVEGFHKTIATGDVHRGEGQIEEVGSHAH